MMPVLQKYSSKMKRHIGFENLWTFNITKRRPKLQKKYTQKTVSYYDCLHCELALLLLLLLLRNIVFEDVGE